MNTFGAALLTGLTALLCLAAVAVLAVGVLSGPRVSVTRVRNRTRWAITGNPELGARAGIVGVLVAAAGMIAAPDPTITTITQYVLIALSVLAVALVLVQAVDNVHRNGITATTEATLLAAAVAVASAGTFVAVLVTQTRNSSVNTQAAAAVADPNTVIEPVRWAVTAAIGVLVIGALLAARSWLSRHSTRRDRTRRRGHAHHNRTARGSNVRDQSRPHARPVSTRRNR